MPLGLVDIQQLAHLLIKCGVNCFQPLGEILVYSAFGNVKLLCGGADCRLVFNNVHRQIAGSLLNICMHIYHSPNSHSQCICALGAGYESVVKTKIDVFNHLC